MSDRYDIIIVGTGPAGLSAALNAKIRGKKFALYGSKNLSNKVEKAHKINNYLGFYGKSGSEIKEAFQKHIDEMGIEIIDKKVNTIYPMGDYFSYMVENEVHEATSVILATGVNFGKPFPGEEEYLGKGVGYCATCDAPLYRDKDVAIIAYNKAEEEEANFMAEICKKVYYIPMYQEEVSVDDKIEIIKDKPLRIEGEQFVNKLVLENQELILDGVFILRDSVNPDQLVPGLKMDEQHVAVDRKMQTSIPGCFAAGDIVGTPYQYSKAAGEGNIASLSAVSYVDKKKRD
ncbi:thioredoxin reductase [Lachnospiraceae bacterium KM106-2]|nr:thioredoxin reductase [Lachnospiraceae bacterium KM106-2]